MKPSRIESEVGDNSQGPGQWQGVFRGSPSEGRRQGRLTPAGQCWIVAEGQGQIDPPENFFLAKDR